MPEKKTWVLRSDFSELDKLDGIVEEIAAGAGLDVDRREALMLALSEAVTNAIKHGNRQDETRKVTLGWNTSGDDLTVFVEDEGRGFDPGALPDPLNPENLLKDSGRGVFLMKTYCDAVRFENGGRKVVLSFSLA
ncbi:MAG: anti sigma factor serine-protein kinase [Bacteroidetes bacterium HLUCCA01]|nr:MAG: anti sigma factor serine-protein kinase [Bacteroidetes bacterium HLUCCA01]